MLPHSCFESLETRTLFSADLLTDPPAPAGAGESAFTASARSSTIPDARGDFLPTYTGPHHPGLDAVRHQVTLAGDRVIFFAKMAGPIAPTQEIGGLYLFGIDRGRGTPRFRAGTPLIGAKVVWDSIVRINP